VTADILQFPRKQTEPAQEPKPELRQQAFTRTPRPCVERPVVQGVLNQIPVGKFAAILPSVTDEQNVIEALLAATQFYAVGGVDQGERARKALAKFQQSINPQPPLSAA
jgi:hypothetical protein